MFLAALLLALLPRLSATKGQGGVAGSPQSAPHVVQTATCCGLSIAVDQTNLASIVECSPSDASCTQGIAVCFSDGTCSDVAVGNGAASVRYWKQSTVAGVPQRLDVIVGNISAHASPTTVGWMQTQGAPLP
jgi:hypothetical protein